MGQAVPLVRAIAMMPTLSWLARQGYSVEQLLKRHQLTSVLYCSPLRPVPLTRVANFLKETAEAEGPDLPFRVVTEADPLELAQIGRVALGARTPHEAITRIANGLPYYCSHELLTLETVGRETIVRHAYGVRFDPVAGHLMLQYAVAVLERLCGMATATRPRLRQLEVLAHPEFGVEHLLPWLGESIITSTNKQAITVWIPSEVANRKFGKRTRDRSGDPLFAHLKPLRGDGRFTSSVHVLVAAMLEDGVPTVMDIAQAAGMSSRTMQRRLQEEGQSFKQVLDAVRQEQAELELKSSGAPMSQVAASLGYRRQASLTRSMRRWTGVSPIAYRNQSD
ncbi:helix-turn-helix domain-containing protein [Stappia indica]|uniref:helix-turn-helix domain-containing protein n=1 Tax=Stappia indica TaxID=538381 RepID=UPI001CD19E77|nr:AraC family transcriptional regulator [Stappia indica]MCA1300572.1 AraC family transcriptional regulator [Stappia indica]